MAAKQLPTLSDDMAWLSIFAATDSGSNDGEESEKEMAEDAGQAEPTVPAKPVELPLLASPVQEKEPVKPAQAAAGAGSSTDSMPSTLAAPAAKVVASAAAGPAFLQHPFKLSHQSCEDKLV